LNLDLDEERRKGSMVNGATDSIHNEIKIPEMQLLEIQRKKHTCITQYCTFRDSFFKLRRT